MHVCDKLEVEGEVSARSAGCSVILHYVIQCAVCLDH